MTVHIKMLRAWAWRGAWLQKDQELHLAPQLAEVLLKLGVAERMLEEATTGPTEAPTGRKKRGTTRRKPKAKR